MWNKSSGQVIKWSGGQVVRWLCIFLVSWSLGHLSTCLYAASHHTITIDGNLSDWMEDERISPDENDSDWDPGTGKNEIRNLYITWDAANLYIGIEGKITDKGILLYLDSGQNKGQSDLTQINSWNRKVKFENFKPDYFYGAWDGSDGNFYRIKSSVAVEDISGKCYIKNSKTFTKTGWELKIPFDLFYSKGNTVPIGAKIYICASLATGDVGRDSYGDYGYLGGDTVPNGNNFVNGLTTSTLRSFVTVEIDKNLDGNPDNTYAALLLQISEISISPVKFVPSHHINTAISFKINKPATAEVGIYTINGELIRTLSETSPTQNFSKVFYWDGKTADGSLAKSGVYIVNIKVDSSSESKRLNKAIVVVK